MLTSLRLPPGGLLLMLAIAIHAPSPALAQQPFVVDDADVTPERVWHVEISSQIDGLRRSARPGRWQNALEWEIDYGIARRIELSAVVPLITLGYVQGDPRGTDTGIGDSVFGVKYRFTDAGDARTMFAGSLTVEVPSGSRRRELGSGLTDYGLNGIWQRRLDDRWTWRGNAGVTLAGNTQTGLLGIRERGAIVTGGTSLVAGVSDSLQLGSELTFAWSHKASVSGRLAAWQAGGNVALWNGGTLDLAVSNGWGEASPRVGFQLGISIDLTLRKAPPALPRR